MSRLLALVCLLVSVAVLWMDARDAGKVIEGYPLIAALAIMGAVSMLALHIYAEKNTVPATGEEFVSRFLSNLGVASLSEAKRLIGNAVQAAADAEQSRGRMRTAESERNSMRKERDKANRSVTTLQGKLDSLTPRLDELEKAEKARLAAAKLVTKADDATKLELEGVRAELDRAQAEVTRITGELGLAQTDVTRLTGELSLASPAAARVPQLEIDLTAANDAKNEAGRRLSEEQAAKRTAEQNLQLAQERVRALEEEVRTHTARISTLEDELRKKETAPAVDPEALTALRREKEALEGQLRDATSATRDAERRCTELGSWKLDAEPKLAALIELQPKHTKLLIDLGNAERARDEAKARVLELDRTLAKAAEASGGTEQTLVELRGQLSNQRTLVEQKQKEFEAALALAQGQLGDAIIEIGRLRENPPGLAEAKLKIDSLEGQIRELTAAGVTLQEQFDGQGKALAARVQELATAQEQLTARDVQVSALKRELARIPELEQKVAAGEVVRSRLALLEIGDRELDGVTLKELREARDAVVAAMDMEELGLRQINFALVYTMALNPGPELKALGVDTKQLVDYVSRAWDDVLNFNPDRLRSLLHKKGAIPTAAWNQHLRVKRQREMVAAQRDAAAKQVKPS